MATLNEEELREGLRAEGFRRIYVWQDGPHAYYPEHTHATETAHVILDGEMTVTMNGGLRTYKTGERCDVPAGAEHCARMGPRGCKYLIGER
jgi:mannose-6-phosphate isomerase-like protein (cupin superfamily)